MYLFYVSILSSICNSPKFGCNCNKSKVGYLSINYYLKYPVLASKGRVVACLQASALPNAT